MRDLAEFATQLLIWTGLVFTLFRTTRLVTEDTFPPIKHLRDKIYPPTQGNNPKWYQELISCPWCASFWLGIPTLLIANHFLPIRYPILCFFTMWSLTGILADNHG